MFEEATDCAPQAIQIAESYVLLAPDEVLSDNIRFPMLVACRALLKSTTRQHLGIVPRLVELIIRGVEFVDGGSENAYSIISQTLVESQFLSSLLEGIYSSHEASQTTGPNKKRTSVYGVVETDYYSVLARLALGSPGVFISAVSTVTGTSEEQTLTWILTEWFLHFDNIGSVTQKKLHALGLTQLLTLNINTTAPPPVYILNHLQSYLTMWTDLATELAEGTEDDDGNPQSRGRDYLVYWNEKKQQHNNNGDEEAASITEVPESERKRAWKSSDVVHRVNFGDYVREVLQSLIVRCGGEQRFQEDWLGNVDREVVGAFGALGIL